jgi:hypothetical protein
MPLNRFGLCVEPLLRNIVDIEIDSRAPLDEVVAQIIRVATTV